MILQLQLRVVNLKHALGMDATGWFDRYQATREALDACIVERDRWAVRCKEAEATISKSTHSR